MRRLFWLAMGVTIGALVVRKLSAAAQKLTPRGLAHSLGGGLADLSESIREFGADVRTAMHEREAELRESTGLDGASGGVRVEPTP
jgi:chromosome condensin MukBEF MukE localization factor